MAMMMIKCYLEIHLIIIALRLNSVSHCDPDSQDAPSEAEQREFTSKVKHSFHFFEDFPYDDFETFFRPIHIF